MSAKELRFGGGARHALVRGASVLVRAIKATLGPRGRNVVKQRSFGGPTITKDGVSMAKKIELDDPFENMGVQMVKEVSTKVVRVAFRTTGSGALTVGSSAPCVILANSASSTNPSSLVTF